LIEFSVFFYTLSPPGHHHPLIIYLIDVVTYELKYFNGAKIRGYAILSHTWVVDEASYQHMRSGPHVFRTERGFWRIDQTCREARRKGIFYAWADTSCIDKTSSAELQK